MVNQYCEKTNLPSKYWFATGRQPLFLKAHQELNNLAVKDIEYLLTKKKEYRIAFGSENRDWLYHYRDAVLSKDPFVSFPEHIFEYKRYMPNTVPSNTIYYTTLDMDLKDANKNLSLGKKN